MVPISAEIIRPHKGILPRDIGLDQGDHIGSGSYGIYVDPNPHIGNPVVLGYRGSSRPVDRKGILGVSDPEIGIPFLNISQSNFDAALYYCPYVPLVFQGDKDKSDQSDGKFVPRTRYVTNYGITSPRANGNSHGSRPGDVS